MIRVTAWLSEKDTELGKLAHVHARLLEKKAELDALKTQLLAKVRQLGDTESELRSCQE